MSLDGFWLFEGLAEEPYGLLPLVNLSGKGGPTSTKSVERIGSYQWYLDDKTPTIVIPGMPPESFFWAGGKLQQDHGVVIYDVNHLKVPTGSLDTMILAAQHLTEKAEKPINFDDYDFITDAVNLQKLFAFAQEAGDGLFRIDVERVGKTILFARVEASDLMEIGHVTFDQALKRKMTKPKSKLTTGPFFQLVSYQFGQFKLLVRFEVDCADYAAVKMPRAEYDRKLKTLGRNKMGANLMMVIEFKLAKRKRRFAGAIFQERNDNNFIMIITDRSLYSENNAEVEMEPRKEKFKENDTISFIEYGEMPRNVPLQLLTTYPQGAGFPFFTWAQMFFTTADQEIVGWFKGNGDFSKPAMNALPDISKLIKPLPYVALAKVHDCLTKIAKFLIKNDSDIKCSLIWKGKNHLEIFTKTSVDGAVSPGVKKLLQMHCREPDQLDE
ncbi:unnamed protein product [Thelazia callipaeda]|uniref:Decapping nuclease n=1 Tax=Thelazia callipaeda TaxID=103827 RepID=A0A0N5D1F0_THECL|nr:unnamed protein product [Thelazia callipaeda]